MTSTIPCFLLVSVIQLNVVVTCVPQVEVHWRLKGEPDTLYLCINILDRFLDRKQVPKNKLQLVGVTAYLVSAPTAPIEPSMRAVHHFI